MIFRGLPSSELNFTCTGTHTHTHARTHTHTHTHRGLLSRTGIQPGECTLLYSPTHYLYKSACWVYWSVHLTYWAWHCPFDGTVYVNVMLCFVFSSTQTKWTTLSLALWYKRSKPATLPERYLRMKLPSHQSVPCTFMSEAHVLIVVSSSYL